MVYSGRTAGADTKDSGGGANAQCLPTNPEYLTTINGTQSTSSSITGAEYEANSITPSSNHHDVPVQCVSLLLEPVTCFLLKLHVQMAGLNSIRDT